MDTLLTLELIHCGVVNMKIKQIEIDVTTGEEKIVEITLTKEQETEILAKREKAITEQAEAESKAAQRQLILDKLGLTADEARLLLG